MINIVLYRPEKPLNTGNIMRTSMASNSKLHIIGPLTFTIDDKGLKRAGLDYLKDVSYNYYESYEEFLIANDNPEILYITRYGKKPHSSIDFNDVERDYFIMFGRESSGIPLDILKKDLDNCYRIPMRGDARSLNLSNCVAIVVYEALRQQDYNELASSEVIKGEDFLMNS
jgi:tRNA (cytidine/uridine-2'-O-)-methyltransferase